MLSLAELEARGVGAEQREVRAWRLQQRGPTGGRLGLRELAQLVGVSRSTLADIERGKRTAGHVLRVRLWALVLGGPLDWSRPKQPLAKARRQRASDPAARQMLLPFA
jgi:transcriptional regulator with XRE-family HTH domain